MFCYDESVRTNSKFDLSRVNPNKCWETHYQNLMYLTFLSKNPKSTFQEKRQAEAEIQIAQRKLTFWSNDKRFVQSEANNAALRIKKDWQL